MIGDKLREARLAQQLSLTEVAGKAKVSVATLSRIETNKQALGLNLFMTLSRVLKVPAHHFLEDAENGEESTAEPLASKISRLGATDRARLWRDLATSRRTERNRRGSQVRNLAQHVEELVAQIDFLREEIETVRTRVRRRK